MPKRLSNDSDWSFNFMNDVNACDSDDSDAGLEDSTPAGSLHGCKVDDIDLSSREEAVIYKPNPFSIAKINAAIRGDKKTGARKSPRQTPIARRKSGQCAIAEGFQKQEARNKSIQRNSAPSTTAFAPGITPSDSHLEAPSLFPASAAPRNQNNHHVRNIPAHISVPDAPRACHEEQFFNFAPLLDRPAREYSYNTGSLSSPPHAPADNRNNYRSAPFSSPLRPGPLGAELAERFSLRRYQVPTPSRSVIPVGPIGRRPFLSSTFLPPTHWRT
jgi:hypothetical protein